MPSFYEAVENLYMRLSEAGTELHSFVLHTQSLPDVHWAASPYSCEDVCELYSLSKIFTSTAAGLAYDMGLLSPDMAVLPLFPEYSDVCSVDSRWSSLKIRHILSMTTGHDSCVMASMAFAENSIRAFFTSSLSHQPGTHFCYNTGATCVAAEIVRRLTGMNVPSLLDLYLFKPLDIHPYVWETCRDGHCQGGTGLSLSCSDVAKLGQLYLQRGIWKNCRLLSEEWIDQAVSIQASTDKNGTPDWSAGYGYQFWMNHDEGFRGDGAFGQFCLILPQSHTVFTALTESTNMNSALLIIHDFLHQVKDIHIRDSLPVIRYIPPKSLSVIPSDSGWQLLPPHPSGIRRIRIALNESGAMLSLEDDDGVQRLHALIGRWQENTLFSKNLRPTLFQMMPRDTRQPIRAAISTSVQEDGMILFCRSLNTPHAFCVNISQTNTGLSIRFVSPLNVFKSRDTKKTTPILSFPQQNKTKE